MTKFLALLISCMAIISCKSTQYGPGNYTGRQIVFASAGGVTGTIREYALFENGQLFLSKGVTGQWKELKKVKGSLVREAFERADELSLDTLKFDRPGNMTYSITIKKGKKSNTVKWGSSDAEISTSISEYYHYFTSRF